MSRSWALSSAPTRARSPAGRSNDYLECTLSDLTAEDRLIKVTGSPELAAGDELSGYAGIRAVDDRPADPESANDYTSMSIPVGS